mmetsp:Transcript_31086/g.31362  ORF Transcript_31086/g.31362 Transcript_31086/m.31362 type:complete len:90 (-) Transcript_31086:22-291(-)
MSVTADGMSVTTDAAESRISSVASAIVKVLVIFVDVKDLLVKVGIFLVMPLNANVNLKATAKIVNKVQNNLIVLVCAMMICFVLKIEGT